MVLAACCIWSIASSIAVIRSLMRPRSKGVMKVRRAANRTSRVISSASCSRSTISRQLLRHRLAALQQLPQRFCAGDQGVRMVGEQLEEAVFLRHEGLEPCQHFGPQSRRQPSGETKPPLAEQFLIDVNNPRMGAPAARHSGRSLWRRAGPTPTSFSRCNPPARPEP
jgi:hypothetical protein